VSYFSQPKTERDKKPVNEPVAEPRPQPQAQPAAPISMLGHGMVITGNIVSTDPVEIHGRVAGDIQASRITICQGAEIEGKIVAQDAVIQGVFKGTVHANNVKLSSTAIVNGEIYNRSLAIESDAQFEGVSRRLDKPVETPAHAKAEPPTHSADVVSITGGAVA
jgi:cytoskeletal protein CcmA (bactofilin family)